jgi:predicted glycoside hydrolase/deacetylase ChbG (UPF0249 family)
MGRFLIVNADDYGRSAGVSKGIRAAHRSGIVSSTTVMINLPTAVEELKNAQDQTPTLALGVHLTLTHGAPCSSSEDVQSLVDRKGQFPSFRDWQMRRSQIQAEEVEREFKAQISKFRAIQPTVDHLDSHHHVAVFPEIWPVFLKLAQDLNLGVRLPCPQSLLAGTPTGFLPPEVDRYACEVAYEQLRKTVLPRTDYFLVNFFGKRIGIEDLLAILNNLPPGCTEMMCHPGYVDTALETSSYMQERELELRTLTDPGIREYIEQEDIKIISFQALREGSG